MPSVYICKYEGRSAFTTKTHQRRPCSSLCQMPLRSRSWVLALEPPFFALGAWKFGAQLNAYHSHTGSPMVSILAFYLFFMALPFLFLAYMILFPQILRCFKLTVIFFFSRFHFFSRVTTPHHTTPHISSLTVSDFALLMSFKWHLSFCCSFSMAETHSHFGGTGNGTVYPFRDLHMNSKCSSSLTSSETQIC